MIQGRRCACFTAKTLKRVRVSGKFVGEKLQGDKSTQFGVLCLIYNTHTTTTEFLKDAIVRDGLADHVDTTSPSARSYYEPKSCSQRDRPKTAYRGLIASALQWVRQISV
jgi:hypothetical protein